MINVRDTIARGVRWYALRMREVLALAAFTVVCAAGCNVGAPAGPDRLGTDATVLTIDEHFPVGSGVPITSPVGLRFSQPLINHRDRLPSLIVVGPAGEVAGETEYDATSVTLRWTPATTLRALSTFTVRAEGTARGAWGDDLLIDLEWSFETQGFSGVDSLALDGPEPGTADIKAVESKDGVAVVSWRTETGVHEVVTRQGQQWGVAQPLLVAAFGSAYSAETEMVASDSTALLAMLEYAPATATSTITRVLEVALHVDGVWSQHRLDRWDAGDPSLWPCGIDCQSSPRLEVVETEDRFAVLWRRDFHAEAGLFVDDSGTNTDVAESGSDINERAGVFLAMHDGQEWGEVIYVGSGAEGSVQLAVVDGEFVLLRLHHAGRQLQASRIEDNELQPFVVLALPGDIRTVPDSLVAVSSADQGEVMVYWREEPDVPPYEQVVAAAVYGSRAWSASHIVGAWSVGDEPRIITSVSDASILLAAQPPRWWSGEHRPAKLVARWRESGWTSWTLPEQNPKWLLQASTGKHRLLATQPCGATEQGICVVLWHDDGAAMQVVGAASGQVLDLAHASFDPAFNLSSDANSDANPVDDELVLWRESVPETLHGVRVVAAIKHRSQWGAPEVLSTSVGTGSAASLDGAMVQGGFVALYTERDEQGQHITRSRVWREGGWQEAVDVHTHGVAQASWGLSSGDERASFELWGRSTAARLLLGDSIFHAAQLDPVAATWSLPASLTDSSRRADAESVRSMANEYGQLLLWWPADSTTTRIRMTRGGQVQEVVLPHGAGANVDAVAVPGGFCVLAFDGVTLGAGLMDSSGWTLGFERSAVGATLHQVPGSCAVAWHGFESTSGAPVHGVVGLESGGWLAHERLLEEAPDDLVDLRVTPLHSFDGLPWAITSWTIAGSTQGWLYPMHEQSPPVPFDADSYAIIDGTAGATTVLVGVQHRVESAIPWLEMVELAPQMRRTYWPLAEAPVSARMTVHKGREQTNPFVLSVATTGPGQGVLSAVPIGIEGPGAPQELSRGGLSDIGTVDGAAGTLVHWLHTHAGGAATDLHAAVMHNGEWRVGEALGGVTSQTESPAFVATDWGFAAVWRASAEGQYNQLRYGTPSLLVSRTWTDGVWAGAVERLLEGAVVNGGSMAVTASGDRVALAFTGEVIGDGSVRVLQIYDGERWSPPESLRSSSELRTIEDPQLAVRAPGSNFAVMWRQVDPRQDPGAVTTVVARPF